MRLRSIISAAAVVALSAGLFAAGQPTARAATGPNGLIAFSSWDGLDYDIYTVDPALPDQDPIRLTTDGANNGNPDWSPDGTRIVYDGWGEFGGPRIQVMDADPATDDWTAISEPCPVDPLDCYGDFQPAFSPNGTRIAFVSTRPNPDGTGGWGYELYVMDAIGELGTLADATRLTNDVADEETGKSIADSEVTWSPDGTRIAFLSTGRGLDEDACDIWVMDSHDVDGDGFGDNLQQLTFDESFNCDAFEDVNPKWSPNSSLIAFTSVRTGYWDIWLVNADDPTDLRNVTATPTGLEDQPGWSPDGTRVIFRSAASGAYEMYSLPVPPPATAASRRAAAPTPTRLTFDGTNKTQADWGVVAGTGFGTRTLTVTRQGKGRVTGNKIDCGRDCTGTFVAKTLVTLTATPRTGYRFRNWSGACTGTQRTCTVRLGHSKVVTATFVPRS